MLSLCSWVGEETMTEEQKKSLESKLWDIANTLRGKMNADEFRDYALGFCQHTLGPVAWVLFIVG